MLLADIFGADMPALAGFWGVSLYITIFVGLCLGSFATALAYRIPLGISMVKKERSSCPSCQHDLGILDLVPFFSWAFLRGHCRFCKTSIGLRYPLIEIATLILCLALYARFGFTWTSLILFGLAPVIVAIIDIDFREKIIPDTLNLSIFLIGMAALFSASFQDSNPPDFILEQGTTAIAGVLVWGLGSLLLRFVFEKILKREPMGLGDIKFFAAAGVFLGLNADAASLFLILSGAIGVVLALAWKKIIKEDEFPFGPALLIAFVITILTYPPAFLMDM